MRNPSFRFFYCSMLGIVVFSAHSCSRSVIEAEEITESVYYSVEVKPIIQSNCISCHGSVAPQANLPLTNYEEVKNAAINRNLVSRLKDPSNPMPPNGALSTEDISTIDAWVEGGYLE